MLRHDQAACSQQYCSRFTRPPYGSSRFASYFAVGQSALNDDSLKSPSFTFLQRPAIADDCNNPGRLQHAMQIRCCSPAYVTRAADIMLPLTIRHDVHAGLTNPFGRGKCCKLVRLACPNCGQEPAAFRDCVEVRIAPFCRCRASHHMIPEIVRRYHWRKMRQ